MYTILCIKNIYYIRISMCWCWWKIFTRLQSQPHLTQCVWLHLTIQMNAEKATRWYEMNKKKKDWLKKFSMRKFNKRYLLASFFESLLTASLQYTEILRIGWGAYYMINTAYTHTHVYLYVYYTGIYIPCTQNSRKISPFTSVWLVYIHKYVCEYLQSLFFFILFANFPLNIYACLFFYYNILTILSILHTNWIITQQWLKLWRGFGDGFLSM